MLADKTSAYVNKSSVQPKQTRKRVQLDIQYVAQTFEKTQSINNLQDILIDNKSTDLRNSNTTEESEIEKLSQAYVDKYYYELKFEQYQNLLTQQQGTITKLLNEKQDLLSRLECAKSNEKEISLLQQLEVKFIENQQETQQLQMECQQYIYQIEQLLAANNELQQSFESLNNQFVEYKDKQDKYSIKQQVLISKLTDDIGSQKYLQDVCSQMQIIRLQNNQLSEQLSSQEHNFQIKLQEIQEKHLIQNNELQQNCKSHIEQKEEQLHLLRMELEKKKSEIQKLQNESISLQNYIQQLTQNYKDDIRAQASLLSEQVEEYKIVIQNLDNQLYHMNLEIKQGDRSSSKDSIINTRLLSNYISKYKY
ncbi:unnamed protein product [Paramecium pentaurelia]|uniref:Uncharacterized protein n=1 Tax=Paramecium pentaurelia TaxID=43138 RepID=A0A8S1TAP5_9CILI|nr:unnamed protein product [Paramecium pentaurelia]